MTFWKVIIWAKSSQERELPEENIPSKNNSKGKDLGQVVCQCRQMELN